MAEKIETRIRKEQIAQAALMIIADLGLENLSIARIAKQLGLVPSAIYRHFRSKDALLSAALAHVMQAVQSNLDIASKKSNALDKLEDFLFRQLAIIRQIRALPRIVFASAAFFDTEAGRRISPYLMLNTNLGLIAAIIAEGQEKGEISRSSDPHTIALQIFGIVMPAMILWHVSEGEFDVNRQAKKSWKLVRKMLEPNSSIKEISE